MKDAEVPLHLLFAIELAVPDPPRLIILVYTLVGRGARGILLFSSENGFHSRFFGERKVEEYDVQRLTVSFIESESAN